MSAQSHVPKRKAGSFYPPQRTLMGPGPSDIHPRVLSAMGRPTIGYLDPVFVEMMEELKGLLRYAFQTRNALTFPVSGPGSAGMEMCFVNMVNPGDKVIVCRNGVFGGRMIENVERCGGTAVVVDDAWGTPVDPNKVEDALRNNPDAKIVAFVHAETSTGVASDAKSIAALAQSHGALTIMDAVTSLAGIPVLVDEWGIDAAYSGSQKCLSCTPGLSPITFSDRVQDGERDAVPVRAGDRLRRLGRRCPFRRRGIGGLSRLRAEPVARAGGEEGGGLTRVPTSKPPSASSRHETLGP
jgi:alanine-glyoxylate transaminase / serine-glyoxylate transaminase / serine-pyruvate transaminase